MDLVQGLLGLAGDCALRTTGRMLRGIVHNLNNPTHVLTMQTELLLNSLQKETLDINGPACAPACRDEPGAGRGTHADRSALVEKCSRLQRVGEELKNQLDVLAWRDAYTSPAVEILDPVHFGTWFLQFWRNNLFFKHSMTVDLAVEPLLPHVQVIPLALVWSLEEPLCSMASAFCDEQVQTEFRMRFEIQVHPPEGVSFKMLLSPATGELSQPFLDLQHGQEIHALAEALGWTWQHSREENMVFVQVTIPGAVPSRSKKCLGKQT